MAAFSTISGTDRKAPLLSVRNLRVAFPCDQAGEVAAVRGVSLDIPEGRTVALLGESGCGKSLTGLSILGLVEEPGRVSGDGIVLRRNGGQEDLLGLREGDARLRKVRGGEIAMIFQDARASLTPVYTVGEQIAEQIAVHEGVPSREAWQRAVDSLAEVGIPAPERRAHEYPHQMSGGMCQRVMIAMALSCRPRLLIADEPTTALDVTIQAQVLDLLRDLQARHGMAILIITHDMGVVAETADDVCVMYLGLIVERAPVAEIFRQPLHPYTQGLFASMPRPDSDPAAPLARIPGSVPDPRRAPAGCPFRGRCPHEMPICSTMPPTVEPSAGHHVACWLHVPGEARR